MLIEVILDKSCPFKYIDGAKIRYMTIQHWLCFDFYIRDLSKVITSDRCLNWKNGLNNVTIYINL